MTMPDSTLQCRLRTLCKIQFGNAGPSPIHSGFGGQLTEQGLDFFFNLQWRHHTSYHHMADTTGTNTICVQDGLTSHTLWQVPQPWRRLCRKIMYQSHLHCIVLVSSFIYRYCKLSDQPSQLVLPTVGKMILVLISNIWYLQLLIITNTNMIKSHNHQ